MLCEGCGNAKVSGRWRRFLDDASDPGACRAEQRPVLLSGYCGEHSLGDDALLESLLSQLPAGLIPLVSAHDESQMQARFGVAAAPWCWVPAVLRRTPPVSAACSTTRKQHHAGQAGVDGLGLMPRASWLAGSAFRPHSPDALGWLQ